MVAGFDELQKYYGEILTDRTISEFERQAGILGKTIQNNAKAADAIVNASFHNATYSDRIWMYQDMLKNELSSLLQTGLIQGQNPRKLATHLRKRFGVSQYNAERLMITELARVQTEAQKQSFLRNGFTQYTFLALGNACEDCRDLDGKHFDIKEAMPGENAPPIHSNCRCSTAAYEDSDDYEAWLDFLDKGGKTDEWNRLKKKETVPQIKLKDAALRNYNEKEINEIAKQTDELIDQYVKKKSKWSGKIIVDDNAEMYGKLWNCNIVTKSETCAHIILHEQLHARSISYYDEITYINFKKIEEATVELLAQEIGLKEKIKLEESYYDEMVDDLRYINKKLNLYKNNLQFSVELLNKNVDERLDWLDSLIFDRMMKGGTIEEYEEFAKRMDRLR